MQDWTELSREIVFEKYGRGVEKRRYRLPHGTETDFYVSTGRDAVLCLALTVHHTVLLVRQYRIGPEKACLNFPGGSVNETSLEDSMLRELLEETGYVGSPRFVQTVFPSPYGAYREHVFVVTDCKKVGEPMPEDNGESVQVVEMGLQDFREQLSKGGIMMPEVGYIGLEYLKLL